MHEIVDNRRIIIVELGIIKLLFQEKFIDKKEKNMEKKILAMILTAGIIVGIVACGANRGSSDDSNRQDAQDIREDNQVSNNTQKSESETTAKSEESTGKKTEYPLTIITYDSQGNEIETTYEKAPERVVAVYQGSIETLLALGLEDRIVATAGLDNEVPEQLKEAFSKTEYLDEFTPSLETVTMLEPDMIFSWSSLFSEKNLGDVTDWIEKGCNIYYSSNTRQGNGGIKHDRTLENEYTDILNIGKIFDVQDKAEAIVAEIKEEIGQAIKAAENTKKDQTVLIVEPIGDEISNYGKSSLGGDMVTKLGAKLANPDASTIGKEDMIAANPDVIFVVYMPYSGDDPETVKKEQLNVITEDEALKNLDAVKNGRVIPIMLSEMYASATRTQDGIKIFTEGLYPE